MRLYRKPFAALINTSLSDELEKILSKHGKLTRTVSAQQTVYELSVEDYAYCC